MDRAIDNVSSWAESKSKGTNKKMVSLDKQQSLLSDIDKAQIELKAMQSLLDAGLITQEDYDKKRGRY